VQGFLMSPAVPAPAFVELLRTAGTRAEPARTAGLKRSGGLLAG